jgi:hypothetical protein
MSSDLLTAAAEALSAPAALVERSAQARAAADGVSVDDVLAGWTGGEKPAVEREPIDPTPPPEPEPAPPPEQVSAPEPEEVSAPPPEPVPSPEPAKEPVPVAVAVLPEPEAVPVLEGRTENWFTLVAGAVGLFVVAAVFAFLLPSLDATPASPPPSGISDLGLEGREIYVAEGCWYCHTQQVRPIVSDAKLGPVTNAADLASFAPDTLGIQRIGPDLAHAGSREPTDDAEWLAEFLRDPQSVREGTLQPAYDHLSESDLTALVQYLLESR